MLSSFGAVGDVDRVQRRAPQWQSTWGLLLWEESGAKELGLRGPVMGQSPWGFVAALCGPST